MAAVGDVFYTFVPQKLSSGNVSDYTKTGDQTVDDMVWNVPGNWYATGALRIGGKSIDAVDRIIAGKTAMGDAIAKIVITHAGVTSDNLKLNSVKVVVASDADFTQDVVDIVAVAGVDYTIAKNTEGTIEFTPKDADFWAKDAYYKFEFNVSNSNGSNYAFVLNKIEFYSYSDVAQTYWTVAGNPASVFGEEWKPALKANDMVKQEDGSYKWEKTDLELAAGKVEFKVVKDHSWAEAYPSENYELNIAEVGKYTITINFNPESKEVTANAEKTGEAEVDPTAAVRGSFNGWAGGDMTLAEDKKSASIVLALEEKDYEFKMVINDAWLGNGYEFHRDFTSVEGLDENSANMILKADVAGDYTITWTFESKKMEITFPKKPEVLPEGAFKLTFNGTGEADKDASAAYGTEVEAIFDAASAPYVASVETATKVYAGRPIADDNSSLKFGTSSAAGSLAFTLATPVEVDSIIVNAAQYGNDAAEVTVNGVKFDLTAGNKVPTDCKLVANGEISQITIEQTGSQRIYVRYVTVYAKTSPTPPTPVDPTAAVTGDMTEWGEPIPFELSEDKKKATLFNDNIKAGTYAFKMIINGEWRSNGYEFHRGFPGCAGITGNTEANMTVIIDVEGAYTFEWYFENDSLAIIFPEKPEPVFADGYYLMGSFNEWAIDAKNLFVANPDAEGEYQLSINLAEGDEIKVAFVEADEAKQWFPKEGNVTIDKNHAGETTMYFRAEYNEAWAAFGGYFYIVPTGTEGIEETLSEGKAVKVLREGNILIMKGNHTYTVVGQIVK